MGVSIATLKCRQDCIYNSAIDVVLNCEDGFLLREDGWDLPEHQTGERDIHHTLEITLDDLVQDQTADIAVETDMSISKDINEGLELAGENDGQCDDRLPPVEHDRLPVVTLWLN